MFHIGNFCIMPLEAFHVRRPVTSFSPPNPSRPSRVPLSVGRLHWLNALSASAGHLVVSDQTPRAEMRIRSESRLNMMVLLLQKIRHLVATNTHSTKRCGMIHGEALFPGSTTQHRDHYCI